MAAGAAIPTQTHGTAVAVGTAGLLIVGASGTGKSTLAIQMMALGAVLVADDRVDLVPRPEGGLLMLPPDRLAGIIEARGLGLVAAGHAPALLTAVVDLDVVESERIPEWHETVIAGSAWPCLRKVETPAFPAMLVAYLKGGRVDV